MRTTSVISTVYFGLNGVKNRVVPLYIENQIKCFAQNINKAKK